MADPSRNTPTQDRPVKPASAADFPVIQDGRYRFIEVIGAGGAGTVYRALDTTLDKHVAVKKLHDSASSTAAIRFQREAQLAGLLRHENVLSARDFGLTAKNEPYLILDFVEGENLSALVRRVGPLPMRDALAIFVQLARGLVHAHYHGVIHRDIKPSNAMLVGETDPKTGGHQMVAKIVDFGLAKSVDDQQRLTKTNIAVGTPGFMSPEQLHGDKIDVRSDIYSFGCLMFQVLTGQAPFEDSGQAGLIGSVQKQLSGDVPSLKHGGATISENLDAIVRRCLMAQPSDRYQSMDDLLSSLTLELERIDQEPPETDLDVNARHPSKTSKGFPQRWLVSSGCVLILLMVLAFFTKLEFEKQQAAKGSAEVGTTKSGSVGFKKKNVTQAKGDDFDTIGSFVIGEEIIHGCWSVENPTDAQVMTLTKADHVKEVVLKNSSLTRSGFEHLDSLGTVKKVTAIEDAITKDYIEDVLRIKTLDTIQISRPRSIDFNALGELAKSHVYDVVLHEMSLNQIAFDNIVKIKTINYLALNDCTGLTPDGLKTLTKLPKLWHLQAENSDITDDGIAALIKCPTIAEIFVPSTALTDQALKYLGSVKKLSQIEINGCNVSAAAKKELKRRLPRLEFRAARTSNGLPPSLQDQ